VKKYRIKTDPSRSEYFDLIILSTQKGMNKYVELYSDKHGMKIEHDAHTAGLVQGTQIHEYPAMDDRKWFSSHFATMFLNEEQLCLEIIAHECLHLAMAHERFVVHFDMRYGGELYDDISDEERLAYFHGRVFDGVYAILKKNGHLKGRKR
jgi:hypothetical protein